jgi:hypothetical protein
MFRSLKSICYGIIFLFILLSISSCTSLFVSHCGPEKGRGSLNKKKDGGKINSRDSKKFERFKGKDPDEVSPSNEKKKPRNQAKF